MNSNDNDQGSVSPLAAQLARTGQVASFGQLESLVDQFEQVLNRYGVKIAPGSDLEAVCLSATDILGKHKVPDLRNPQEDVRKVFGDALGIWTFLTKLVRLGDNPSIAQFVPHLNLLNEGTVGQNKRLPQCEEATNKIFELLFALVLLDVGTDLVLDHPDLAKGTNPDILVTLGGQRWGFACKTVYGQSGKTFFDNLKKGVDQIEVSEATVGCVMVNFRNLIPHDKFWPILNKAEFEKGDEPIFGAALSTAVWRQKLADVVWDKRDDVNKEIGASNVDAMFTGKKAIPGFLAFCQTICSIATPAGPVPTLLSALALGDFSPLGGYASVFDQINNALHERAH